jgi:hypothetical protein
VLVILAIAANVLANGLFDLRVPPPRKHLKPIPIAASACPYVSLMHAAANNFQSAEPSIFGVELNTDEQPVPWPQERVHLNTTLSALETSIVIGIAHFPAPIRQQLAVTLAAVREGRVLVARSHNGQDLPSSGQPPFDTGQLAFGYASDLVGTQCGVTLGADSNITLYPVVSTTTRPAHPPTCTAGQLNGESGWGGVEGSANGDITLRNTGEPCTLDIRGAGITLLAHGVALPLRTQPAGQGRIVEPRVLPADGTADVIAYWFNWCKPNPGPLQVSLTLPSGGAPVIFPFNRGLPPSFVPRCDQPNSPSMIEFLGFAAGP